MDAATPTANVSAFCRAVLRHVIPHEFWGTETIQSHNEGVFHKNIDRFITMRRFESLSLHEAFQDIKVIAWSHSPIVERLISDRLQKSNG